MLSTLELTPRQTTPTNLGKIVQPALQDSENVKMACVHPKGKLRLSPIFCLISITGTIATTIKMTKRRWSTMTEPSTNRMLELAVVVVMLRKERSQTARVGLAFYLPPQPIFSFWEFLLKIIVSTIPANVVFMVSLLFLTSIPYISVI